MDASTTDTTVAPSLADLVGPIRVAMHPSGLLSGAACRYDDRGRSARPGKGAGETWAVVAGVA